nr:MAG: phosphate transport regulator [Thermoproteus sp. AZ2]
MTAGLKTHIGYSTQALELIYGVINAADLNEAYLDEVVRKISALEREGDEIIRRLHDEMAKGALVPSAMGNAELLLDRFDNVLDSIYYIAKEIRRGFIVWRNESIRKVVSGQLKEMLDLDKTAIEYISIILDKSRDLEFCGRYARMVSTLEEEVDEVKERILDEVYKLNLSAVEFNHVISLIYTADKIADNLQDAAFLLISIISAL